MVETTLDPDTGNGHIVLTPNNSSSWRLNCYVIASLVILSSIIAIGFLLNGLWLILPFTGLELTAVFIGLYLCARNSNRAEVITFADDSVVIEQGHRRPENRWQYQRPWSRILVIKPEHPDAPGKVFMHSRDSTVELGAFLNKQDKERLVAKLRVIIYDAR